MLFVKSEAEEPTETEDKYHHVIQDLICLKRSSVKSDLKNSFLEILAFDFMTNTSQFYNLEMTLKLTI